MKIWRPQCLLSEMHHSDCTISGECLTKNFSIFIYKVGTIMYKSVTKKVKFCKLILTIVTVICSLSLLLSKWKWRIFLLNTQPIFHGFRCFKSYYFGPDFVMYCLVSLIIRFYHSSQISQWHSCRWDCKCPSGYYKSVKAVIVTIPSLLNLPLQ
jgi:hypothetical protein